LLFSNGIDVVTFRLVVTEVILSSSKIS